MIKNIIELLKNNKSKNETILRAKGKYKFPTDISEFKNYIKTRI